MPENFGAGSLILLPFQLPPSFGGERARFSRGSCLMRIRYEDDPEKFEAMALDLVRKHAPPIYERVNLKEFSVTRPPDVLQGAVTPTVRCGYTPLADGKYAMALRDMHILNDPIIAQGANAASRCAWPLGEALLQDRQLDETFCRETERRLWEAGRATTEWTNMTIGECSNMHPMNDV